METKLKTITDEQKKKKMLAGIFFAFSSGLSPESKDENICQRSIYFMR